MPLERPGFLAQRCADEVKKPPLRRFVEAGGWSDI
jgi:hypothetical protein